MKVRAGSFALLLLLGVACSSTEAPQDGAKQANAKQGDAKQDEPKSAERAANEQPEGGEAGNGQTKEIAIASAQPPVVTVLRAGTDPKPLRFSPEKGSTESVDMRTTTTVDVMGTTIKAPAMVTTISTEIDDVTDEAIHAIFRFASMKVEEGSTAPAPVVSQLESMAEQFQAFEASVELDRRGALRNGTVRMPQNLPAPLQQMMNQMQEGFAKVQVPLPAEPVGVGGRWKAVSSVDQGGMKLQQTATYDLLSRDGDVLQVGVVVEQKTLDNTFTPPGATGVTGTVERFEGSGKGSLEIQLGKLSPLSSSMNVDVDMKLEVSVAGQKQTQEMKMAVEMELGPTPS